MMEKLMATVSGKQGTRFTNGTELVGGLRPQAPDCQRFHAMVVG